jgi:hypothetical protein
VNSGKKRFGAAIVIGATLHQPRVERLLRAMAAFIAEEAGPRIAVHGPQ